MLESKIAEVRTRLRSATAARWATIGALIGLALILVVKIIALAWAEPLTASQFLSLWFAPLAFAALGGFFGGTVMVSDRVVAGLIDERGALKDRATTMLQLREGASDSNNSIGRLQREEATPHLASVDAIDCVDVRPGQTPLRIGFGLVLAIAVTWSVGFFRTPEVSASMKPRLATSQAAGLSEKMLPDL
ncbi:MAG: hypothetical protein AAGJ83_03385 [Planctomycetota bacterium]